jgi:hypothetical protein
MRRGGRAALLAALPLLDWAEIKDCAALPFELWRSSAVAAAVSPPESVVEGEAALLARAEREAGVTPETRPTPPGTVKPDPVPSRDTATTHDRAARIIFPFWGNAGATTLLLRLAAEEQTRCVCVSQGEHLYVLPTC